MVEAVDTLAERGLFGGDRVLVQLGYEPTVPRHCDSVKLLTMDEFGRHLETADLIISHGGAGTLLWAVRLGRVPVAMPRRKKYGEHVNDHQVQLVEALARDGLVILAREPADLPGCVSEVKRGRTGVAARPPSRMVSLVAEAIDELTRGRR